MARRLLELLLIVACPTLLAAQGSGTASTPKRPEYAIRRFDEDWSVLRDGSLTQRDVWDRVKFIPLTKEEHAWLTVAGQARERGEDVREFQFGESEPEQSDTYLLSRLRLSGDLHATRYFRVYAEARSSLATRRDLSGGDSASYVDELDLENGFADVLIPVGASASLTLRAGRQELLFGSERLIGPSDFSNVRRTFQGASAIVQAGSWAVTTLWTELVVVSPHTFDEASPGNKLYGAYASRTVKDAIAPDVYWFSVDNASASFNGTSGRERRQTIGGRLWRGSDVAQVDIDIEGAIQFGTLGANDIRAAMFTYNNGYTLDSRSEPRVFVNVDFASGDGTFGGDVGTFNQLYPTNHAYLGSTDYVGRQNIFSPSIGISFRYNSKLNVSFTQFGFWRASADDALYNSGGSVLRPGTGTPKRHIGGETDLGATYEFDRHVLGTATYNHFFPGAFIRSTGPARGSDYLYAALQFTF